ncbi:hypothetical protein EMIHUDRAFT_252811 [Emiliania huxleyi CCMP1516]|uniref:Uncharacterized protein n=2 Tax=Emiliania huxleyi TaxID=2903 RepID=A0A0D3KG13_EMIH1|nr:hypothetical protein EMIHUDRAFT_252811 [Emiliania huxleyi CCMP1516]EOD34698.1 hypothetical protein EMIHUDRAFT_252811 [Emiliania huxleyi CCMP1516]|eukprot:XP_005787127.1 hypothetical protein EMIHUDRAFT_252811 [Emiliania huxleyi CCMP1516]
MLGARMFGAEHMKLESRTRGLMNGATPSRRGDHYHTAAGRGHGKLARLPALGRPTATLTLICDRV